jgi:hypothetical protein
MAFDTSKYLAIGAKVRVAEPMEVPDNSSWDDDKGRTSGTLKKRLQSLFFQGSRKISAEVLYIAKESERDRLRRKGLIKIRLRDPSGVMLNITAEPRHLVTCN